jgi:hypothetical protein
LYELFTGGLMKYLKYGIFVAIIIAAVTHGYYSQKAQTGTNATIPTLVASETAVIATPTTTMPPETTNVASEAASLQASETVHPPEPLPEPATK